MTIPNQAADQTTPVLIHFTSKKSGNTPNPPFLPAGVSRADEKTVNGKSQPAQIVKAGKETREKTQNFIKQEDSQSNENLELEETSAYDHSQNKVTKLSDKEKSQTETSKNRSTDNPSANQTEKKIQDVSVHNQSASEDFMDHMDYLDKITSLEKVPRRKEKIIRTMMQLKALTNSIPLLPESKTKILAVLKDLTIKIEERNNKNTSCSDSVKSAYLAIKEELQLYSDNVTEICQKFLDICQQANKEKHKSQLTNHEQPDHQRMISNTSTERKDTIKKLLNTPSKRTSSLDTKKEIINILEEFDTETEQEIRTKDKISEDRAENTMKKINTLLAEDAKKTTSKIKNSNIKESLKEYLQSIAEGITQPNKKNLNTITCNLSEQTKLLVEQKIRQAIQSIQSVTNESDEKKIDKETNNIINAVKENILESSERLLKNKKEEYINSLKESSKTATTAEAQTDEKEKKPENTSTEEITDNIKQDARACYIPEDKLIGIIETHKNELEARKVKIVNVSEDPDYEEFEANEIIKRATSLIRELLSKSDTAESKKTRSRSLLPGSFRKR